MKKNFPVSNQECRFSEDRRIVSLTDTKGIVTHVNQDFVEISGYQEDELLGQNHNIVRHPDMPAAGFADLWATIKGGQPWMGLVKNRCKNGDHYWVNAYVTPVYENNNIVGYQSVRTKPRPEWVKRAERFYAVVNGTRKAGLKLPNLGLRAKLLLPMSALMAALAVAAIAVGVNPVGALAALVAALIITGVTVTLATRRLLGLAREAQQIYDNGIALQVYSEAPDEVGKITLALHALQARLTTVSTRMSDAAVSLTKSSHASVEAARITSDSAGRQEADVEQAATALRQMSASIEEIASRSADTARATEEADHQAQQGAELVAEVGRAIEILAEHARSTAAAISSLNTRSDEIGSLLEVIRSVAEQTNLLALNAAIEAARAGEHGRGFAVVADEVRTLATTTQGSAEEIEHKIEALQIETRNAVSAMEKDSEHAEKSFLLARKAGESLVAIVDSAARINDMMTQVAATSEEQSIVCKQIYENIESIASSAESTSYAAQNSLNSGVVLERIASELHTTVRQFD